MTLIKTYVAGTLGYLYPTLGDEWPPGGAKVLLLTSGGICVSGVWSGDGRYMAWSPMPRRTDYTYPTADGKGRPGNNDVLLFTKGEICVFGPWAGDGRYLGWAEKPRRDRAKEARMVAPEDTWRLAA